MIHFRHPVQNNPLLYGAEIMFEDMPLAGTVSHSPEEIEQWKEDQKQKILCALACVYGNVPIKKTMVEAVAQATVDIERLEKAIRRRVEKLKRKRRWLPKITIQWRY